MVLAIDLLLDFCDVLTQVEERANTRVRREVRNVS
jgi:hypothetical protein